MVSINEIYLYFWFLMVHISSKVSADGLNSMLNNLQGKDSFDVRLQSWLDEIQEKAAEQRYTMMLAHWNYNTDVTTENAIAASKANSQFALFREDMLLQAEQFPMENVTNELLARLLRKIKNSGLILDQEDTRLFTTILNRMTTIYNTNPICSWSNGSQDCTKLWSLDPDLIKVLANSRDYDLLMYVWQEWRVKIGRPIKQLYAQFVNISNAGAVAGGYSDLGEWWRSWYETNNFTDQVWNLFLDMLPMYEQLHTYVRRQLLKQYQNKFKTSAIPAHVLGDMWAMVWNNLYNFTIPYPNRPNIDITENLIKNNYTAQKMFKLADDFFSSLGFDRVNQNFWNKSVMEKPTDRHLICHASAWDFCNKKDFRIKMCTQIRMEDFITIHHEMGHIQYYMQYADQPLTFRNGANPGFHEAIGDTIALSVSTPKHLQAVELLSDYVDDHEHNINYLYKQALSKIAFLPYGFLLDSWRWQVFNGTLPYDKWNEAWWNFRENYQGVVPPLTRSEDDFDPAAKSHVGDNTPYIRYFVAHIIQFQFYKSMCEAAGFKGQLHKCDFYKSLPAGNLLKDMMKLGASVPWPAAMITMTGQPEMSIEPMKEYFKPLMDWLKLENEKAGDCYGWGYDKWPSNIMDQLSTPRCPKTFDSANETETARKWLEIFNTEAEKHFYETTVAQWAYSTNITDSNLKNEIQRETNLSMFQQKSAKIAAKFNLAIITNESVSRQLKKIKSYGVVLVGNDSLTLNNLIGHMTGVYGTGKVCSYNSSTKSPNCSVYWSLDPDITDIMATSRDYDLLSYIWKAWTDTVGRPVKSNYLEFVALSNKGSQAGGFEDTGALWREPYEDSNFQQTVEKLWYQILPLYEQLHAYVRRRLIKIYPGRFNSSSIPSHIFGNMWAQDWSNIFNLTAPYENKPTVDITETMKALNYTPIKMFQLADKFFQSLGLQKAPESFWNQSMFVKPEDGRKVVCHASAWEFYNGQDYRMKMCATVDMENLIAIHHEMGHIQYFLQYAKQPLPFRDGANPGFHEAVGDTIALSVLTPTHLKAIGLLPDYKDDEEQDINFLYNMALKKLAFLPFGYLVDLWRWSVFNSSYEYKHWNNAWTNLRFKYQGMTPPVPRDENDFDPGSKFHIHSNTPYMSYFVSTIIQFQFFKSMCNASNFTGPLHKCDFYNNTHAGSLLSKMLQLGSSKSWTYAMNEITGQLSMNADALMEYFEPLYKYLQEKNHDECFGWGQDWPDEVLLKVSRPRCSKSQPKQEDPEQWLNSYNLQASKLYHTMAEYEWQYWTNVTNRNQELMVKQNVKTNEFNKDRKRFVSNAFNLTEVKDPLLHRQLQKINNIDEALNTNESARYNAIISQMEKIIVDAYVCNETDLKYCSQNRNLQQQQNPVLKQFMAKSKDYSFLSYIWTGWRNKTGRMISNLYKQYISLANKGSKIAGFYDHGHAWRSAYEDPNLESKLEELWRQILPLYEQLHTYVRRKLSQIYPQKFNTSAIPAHILGSMWAEDWSNLFKDIMPYPAESTLDVTNEMVAQNYTVLKMFKTAEEFFTSIGLYNMTDSFWNISMMERPTGKQVNCVADAENFYNGHDYAIRMCTQVNTNDLILVHREMGRVQYFMAYSKQPLKLQSAANPGFEAAIGDTIALSMSTPQHLRSIGLLPQYKPNEKQEINFLFKAALNKIAVLPFPYLTDLYRWKLFNGTVPLEQMNEAWWELAIQYQGIVWPTSRSKSDFDAGAKYQVVADLPYVQVFISHILQFQFYSALCREAKYTGPLYNCDFYNDTSAGKLLKNMMELGSSVHWSKALLAIAKTTEMSAAPMLEYFSKLTTWLQKANEEAKDCFGWGVEWPENYNFLPLPRCSDVWLGENENRTNSTSIVSSPPSGLDPMIIATLTIVLICLVALITLIILVVRWKSAKNSK